MGLVKNLSFAITPLSGLMFLAAVPANAASVTLSYNTSIGRPADFSIGEFPGIPGTLAAPQGVSVQESTGNIFIANGRGIDRVEVFDTNGNYLKGIGSTGTGPGQFDEPAALAFEPATGNLYVGDVFNNRVNVYSGEGTFVKSIADGQFGGLIEGRPFFGPSSIAFDKQGFGYVGDYSNDRFLKFNTDGEIVSTIGTPGTEPGQFLGPSGLTISPVTGNLLVADQNNNRIQVLTPEGEAVTTFGTPGTGPGQFIQPIDIEVDEYDNIFVTDSFNSRVQIFDINGNFISQFGEPSGGDLPQIGGTTPYGNPLVLEPGVFNWTAGAHYADDKLYVGDFFQGRVQILNVNRSEPVPEPSSMLGLAVLGGGAAFLKLKQRQKLKAVKA